MLQTGKALHFIDEEITMYKTLIAAIAGLSLGAGVVALAEPVHDWHDLDAVHTQVVQAIKEMQTAAIANHWEHGSHASNAIHSLEDAERELNAAIESAKTAH
jgi:hypothetical protein